MRIEVDGDRCAGHAMCVVAADELIDISPDTERAELRQGSEVPPALEDAALMAAAGCPEQAIRVTKD